MKPDVQAARIAVEAHPEDKTHRLTLARTLMDAAWYDPGTTWKANYEEAATMLELLLVEEPEPWRGTFRSGFAQAGIGILSSSRIARLDRC